MCVFIVWVGNGAGPDAPGGGADAETDINLEVSFSEQALIYKEGLKVTEPQNEADDRLPVSQTFTHHVCVRVCVCVCVHACVCVCVSESVSESESVCE